MYFIDLHNILLFLFIILSTSGIVKFRRKPSWPIDKCTVHVFGAEVQRQAKKSPHITSLKCAVGIRQCAWHSWWRAWVNLIRWQGHCSKTLLHKRITCVAFQWIPMPMPYSRLVKLESLGVGARCSNFVNTQGDFLICSQVWEPLSYGKVS